MSEAGRITVEKLIAVVNKGGKIRTGIDIFNAKGRLLLEKDVIVSDPKILENIKRYGVDVLPILPDNKGGIWDKEGRSIALPKPPSPPQENQQDAKIDRAHPPTPAPESISSLDKRISEINEIKKEAELKYDIAKTCIINAIEKIEKTGGEIDLDPISDTVKSLYDFVEANETAFSYLTREIFSYDDYLYNHSINVCIIGTVTMKKFNEHFSSVVNNYLENAPFNTFVEKNTTNKGPWFCYFLKEELQDISIGFFMHDMGKVLIKKEILNKPGRLTQKEFEYVKSHSFEKGPVLLEKNKVKNPFLLNISANHHGRLFEEEERCYPDVHPRELPVYVKVCKLADIYDAMTSKRCYKEAFNPVSVVSEIFRKYAEKDPMLQFILHSFVKGVGIHPPGSFVYLVNGQLCYVLEAQGPVVLPITDITGKTLGAKKAEPIHLGESKELAIDRRTPPIPPTEAYNFIPDYLKPLLRPSG